MFRRIVLALSLSIILPVLAYPAPLSTPLNDEVFNIINKNDDEALLSALMSKKEYLPAIIEFSKKDDLSDAKRWELIAAMTKLGGDKVVMHLRELGIKDRNSWYVRTAAASFLGVIGSKDALDVLHEMLNDRSLVVRTIVVDSIASIGQVRSFDPLVEEMKNKRNYQGEQSLWIRKHIIDAIAKTGNKRAIPVLISYLDDADDEVAKRSKNHLLSLANSMNFNWSKRNWIDWWFNNPKTSSLR